MLFCHLQHRYHQRLHLPRSCTGTPMELRMPAKPTPIYGIPPHLHHLNLKLSSINFFSGCRNIVYLELRKPKRSLYGVGMMETTHIRFQIFFVSGNIVLSRSYTFPPFYEQYLVKSISDNGLINSIL